MKLKLNHKKETRIRRANKNINSYITTIPIDLIKLIGLKEDDKIIWEYEIKGNTLDIHVDFISADTDADAEDH